MRLCAVALRQKYLRVFCALCQTRRTLTARSAASVRCGACNRPNGIKHCEYLGVDVCARVCVCVCFCVWLECVFSVSLTSELHIKRTTRAQINTLTVAARQQFAFVFVHITQQQQSVVIHASSNPSAVSVRARASQTDQTDVWHGDVSVRANLTLPLVHDCLCWIWSGSPTVLLPRPPESAEG